jgi:XTP/dITP diphosphohydrolase
MRLLFGSTNPEKVQRIRNMLADLPVEIVDTMTLGMQIDIAEDGATPEVNARIKALAYYEASRLPALSIDAGLFIDGLPDDRQPGVLVRRIWAGQKAASDQAMLKYYADLIEGLGGQTTGEWTLGIALVPNREQVYSQSFSSRSLFVAKPSASLIQGAPLRSLQVNPDTGQYFSDMTPAELTAVQRERAKGIICFVGRFLLQEEGG